MADKLLLETGDYLLLETGDKLLLEDGGAIALTPDPVAILLVIPAPSIAIAQTVSPSPVTIPLVVPAPALSLSLALAPTPVAVPIVIPAPAITYSQTLTPDPVAITLAIPAPTVTVVPIPPTPVPSTGDGGWISRGRRWRPWQRSTPSPNLVTASARIPVTMRLSLGAMVHVTTYAAATVPLPGISVSAAGRCIISAAAVTKIGVEVNLAATARNIIAQAAVITVGGSGDSYELISMEWSLATTKAVSGLLGQRGAKGAQLRARGHPLSGRLHTGVVVAPAGHRPRLEGVADRP